MCILQSLWSHQIQFCQNNVVGLLNFERLQNSPSPETVVWSEKAQGLIKKLVHRVDLLWARQHLFPAPACHRQRPELDLANANPDLGNQCKSLTFSVSSETRNPTPCKWTIGPFNISICGIKSG